MADAKFTPKSIQSVKESANAVWQELKDRYGEDIYLNALEIEFKERKLRYEREKELTVSYKGNDVGRLKADFVLYGNLIIEVKCSVAPAQDHVEQLRGYMKQTGISGGLLVYFPRFYTESPTYIEIPGDLQ